MSYTLPPPDANSFGIQRRVIVDAVLLPYLLDLVDRLTHPAFYEGDPEDVTEMVYQSERFYAELVKGGLGLMIGDIVASMAIIPPEGHILCDGGLYEKSDYPELYDVLDPAFIISATGFRVPDLRGRGIIGAGQGSGLTDRVMGLLLGNENHTLTLAQTPAHNHFPTFTNPASTNGAMMNEAGAMTGTNFGLNASGAGVRFQLQQSIAAGGGAAHNNMQPSIPLRFYVIAK